nr:zinc finger BED domain-containing protein RICESLEEPER 2-like [Ipomoea batatas]
MDGTLIISEKYQDPIYGSPKGGNFFYFMDRMGKITKQNPSQKLIIVKTPYLDGGQKIANQIRRHSESSLPASAIVETWHPPVVAASAVVESALSLIAMSMRIDCGVYIMRHMESYAGQGVTEWDCGLVKGDQAALDRFRLKYIREIMHGKYQLSLHSNVARAIQFLSSLRDTRVK